MSFEKCRLSGPQEEGDLTRLAEQAERAIAHALEVGITLDEIQQAADTRSWTSKQGADGRVDEVLNSNLSTASLARRFLDEIETMFQTRVCGQAALTSDKKERITVTAFNGLDKKTKSIRVGADGNYCLPVGGMESGPVYLFFTASGHRPKVRVVQPVQGSRDDLADIALVPRTDPTRGGIVGVVFKLIDGRTSYISEVYPGFEVSIQGSDETLPATTGEDGIFTVELPPGDYRFISGKPADVTVAPGETIIHPIMRFMKRYFH